METLQHRHHAEHSHSAPTAMAGEAGHREAANMHRQIADEAIARALSGDSLQFLSLVHQEVGQ